MNYNKPYKTLSEFFEDFPDQDLQKLLERAYDIRKFEIELYWTRAGYFWGFLVASFTAYFIVSDKQVNAKPHLVFLVLCIGFVFALSWYLVNRGSKYWQSNWEKIIDSLEEILKCPLYRTNLKNSKKPHNLLSRFPYSVSRINIIVSLYICFIWLSLIIIFFFEADYSHFNLKTSLYILLMSICTILASYYLIVKGKSRKDSTEPYSLEQRFMDYYSPGQGF